MVRIGRVVFDENRVIKVVKEANDGCLVTLEDGVSIKFDKHAKAAWDHFVEGAEDVASGD